LEKKRSQLSSWASNLFAPYTSVTKQYLTLCGRKSKYKCAGQRALASISGPRNEVEEVMVLCPECESDLDVEEDELDEGEILSCTECGSDFEVVGVGPLELTKVGDDIVDDADEGAKDSDEESDY
jgi:alpha-aminoadipate carrier protein LysW